MRTSYGASIPPGISSSTRGQLKVRIDRVVLDQASLEPLIGTDGARRVCETPYLAFFFWGGEDKASPVIQPSSLSTRTGPTSMVFPIKTSRQQCEAYFKHMSIANSGLEIRVLMHDVKKVPDNTKNSKTNVYHITQAESASATLGRALVRLDEASSNHPMAGWFSIVTLPEDSNGFSKIAQSTVLGRMKLSITLEYAGDQDNNNNSRKQQQQLKNNNSAITDPRSRSSSGGRGGTTSSTPHNNTGRIAAQSRLENIMVTKNDRENIAGNDIENEGGPALGGKNQELIVVGHAMQIRPENDENDGDKNQCSGRPSSGRPSSATTKPAVPKVVSTSTRADKNNQRQQREEADALLAAGLKLRQQLANASSSSPNAAASALYNNSNNQADEADGHHPYSRLSLNRAPHEDEEDGFRVTKKNRKAARKLDKYRGYTGVGDDYGGEGDDSDSDDNEFDGDANNNNMEEKIQDMLLESGYPTDRVARIMMGRKEQQHAQQPRNNNNPGAASQHQHQHQHQYDPRYQNQTNNSQRQQQQQQQQQQYTNILPSRQQQKPAGFSSSSSSAGNALVGQFVVRVCVGQLALQQPVSAVKLVARFSPDVLFTVPPDLGCFVSPDVALPIADDDVVGFNVTGIRRMSSSSRVVIELYGKLQQTNANSDNTNNNDNNNADDFTLLGLSMAPICSTASAGVLKNVTLRNPLSGGGVQAQCDLYLSFFRELDDDEQNEDNNNNNIDVIRTTTGKNNTNTTNDVPPQQQQQTAASSHQSSRQQSQEQQQRNEDADNKNMNTDNQGILTAPSTMNTLTAHQEDQIVVAPATEEAPSGHLVIEVIEAKNLQPIRDTVIISGVNNNNEDTDEKDNNRKNFFVSPPSTFAVVDDVMLSMNLRSNGNTHRRTDSSSTTVDAMFHNTTSGNIIEVSANDWETSGPDASRVAVEDSRPQYNLKTEIFLGKELLGFASPHLHSNHFNNERNKRLSHLHIGIHHCRSKAVANKFSSRDSNYLDPERDPAILELLQNSVELGVASVPMYNCLSKWMFPFDGWVHVMDEVTGNSVGQVRVRCHLK